MTPAPAGTAPPAVSLRALFWNFLRIALSGFGGVMPWARRMLVHERRWMTDAEFLDMLALCQLLPGPNIVNVAISVGARFRGAAGALAAFLGLMLAPLTLVLTLGALYTRAGDVGAVRGLFTAVASVAAGMIVSMGVQMARSLRGRPEAFAIAALAFAGVAILRWPLAWVVLGLAPVSIALAARRTR